MMITNVFLSAFGEATITLCVKYVHYGKGCALEIRHVISASKDVQYKRVDHQILVHEDTTRKYFPRSESFILLIYPLKTVSSLWQAAKSVTYDILKEIFSL